MSIRTKVVLSVIAVFVVGAVAMGAALHTTYNRSVSEVAGESVSDAAALLTQLTTSDTSKLSATLTALMQDPSFRDAYEDKDRERLLGLTGPVFETLKKEYSITHWYFEGTEDDPTVFLRVHNPGQFGDELKRRTYAASVASQGFGAGLELGKTAVALRVVHPYYAADGTTVIGYMELGEEIDHFLAEIKKANGDDAALLLTKASMDKAAWAEMRAQHGDANNWDDNEQFVLAASTDYGTAGDALKYTGDLSAVKPTGDVVGVYKDGGRTEVRGVVPVLDVDGKTIGAVFVEHDMTAEAQRLHRERLVIALITLAMLTAVLVAIVVLMNSLIFRRIAAMMSGMQEISTRLAGGDFEVSYPAGGSKDEIGRFEVFFASFIGTVAATLKTLMPR